jgi:HD-like signal output (HDOD) protein
MTMSQRVLTIANSAFYSNTGITTLSRAIVLLAFEQVRMCVTKTLIEQQFEAGSPALRDALVRSFHSTILGKALAHKTGFRRIADVFTSAMFHDLGRTLTIHYFPEEYQAILDHAETHRTDELTASRTILGTPCFELGADVTHEWKFPDSIIQAMRPLRRGTLEPPEDDDTHVAFIAAFANTMGTVALAPQLTAANEQITKLATRSQGVWILNQERLVAALEQADELSLNYARRFKVSLTSQSSLVQLARAFTFDIEPTKPA